MTNIPITPSNRPDIGTPEVAAIKATVKKQELESASSRPSGVLRELALARWRGAEPQVSQRPNLQRSG
jgi:hypothetical protein